MFHVALEYLDFAAKLLEVYVTGKEEICFGHVSSTKEDNHLINMLKQGANAGMSLDMKYAKKYYSKIGTKLNELREGYEYDDHQSKQPNSDVTDK